jgi:hypothetical protein
MDIPPKVFLSYSWANTDIADSIDKHFESIGISFIRDCILLASCESKDN